MRVVPTRRERTWAGPSPSPLPGGERGRPSQGARSSTGIGGVGRGGPCAGRVGGGGALPGTVSSAGCRRRRRTSRGSTVPPQRARESACSRERTPSPRPQPCRGFSITRRLARPEPWRRSRGGSAPQWVLLGPALVFVGVMFALPIGQVLLLSVTDPAVSLAHYRRVFTTPFYLTVLATTFRTSLIVTLACLVLGYPLAYVMARRGGRIAVILLAAVGIAFWTSFLVRTYAWMVILGARGPVAAAMQWVGIASPPQLLFTTFGLDARHDAHPAAVHGDGPLRRHEEDRPDPSARGGQPGRAAAPELSPRVPAAEPPRRGQRLPPGVHAVPRVLRHAGADRAARAT